MLSLCYKYAVWKILNFTFTKQIFVHMYEHMDKCSQCIQPVKIFFIAAVVLKFHSHFLSFDKMTFWWILKRTAKVALIVFISSGGGQRALITRMFRLHSWTQCGPCVQNQALYLPNIHRLHHHRDTEPPCSPAHPGTHSGTQGGQQGLSLAAGLKGGPHS